MSDIRLQDYVPKIKTLIRNSQHDEAIAHCQHILTHYPKHIETYSLLGEICLEKEMYRESIEFFQRALSADPENFIARVGLGILYAEQGSLPEAIWQMERAFELAPGNSEVRNELQRLYAERDGVEMPRLHLTRGALGRLYVRNGLYERAIHEFRAVLADEPELPDIRVALVEALWREGRRLEAVEGCLELLDLLPNCLKANLILGEIWLRGGHDDTSEEKLRLARALDPEGLVAQQMMGLDSPLPREDAWLPELEYEAGMLSLGTAEEIQVPAMPALWGQEPGELDLALGESIGESVGEGWDELETLPDWLQEMGLAEPDSLTPAAEKAAESPAAPLPDWIGDWAESPSREKEAAGLAEAETPEFETEVAQDSTGKDLSSAPMPDWMRELEHRPPQLQEEIEEEFVPDWLKGTVGSADRLPPEPGEEAVLLSEAGVSTEPFADELGEPKKAGEGEALAATPPAVDKAEPAIPASLQALVAAGI